MGRRRAATSRTSAADRLTLPTNPPRRAATNHSCEPPASLCSSAFVGPTAIAGYAGIVVALIALAVAEALTALRRSWRSPVLDVGDRMIDILAEYPTLKETAIDWFGTNDKLALLIGIGVLLTVYAFVMGVVAMRKSLLVGTVMVGLFAIVGAWAALGRANSTLGAIVPTLVGAAVGAASLRFISRRLAAPTATDEPAAAWAPSAAPTTDASPAAVTSPAAPSRRGFLGDAARLLGALGAAAAVLGLGGRAIARTRFSAAKSRKNVTVPTAEEPLAALPPASRSTSPRCRRSSPRTTSSTASTPPSRCPSCRRTATRSRSRASSTTRSCSPGRTSSTGR